MFHCRTDKQTVRTCLAVMGKGCLAASFNCCYLFSGELYPTIIRQVLCVNYFIFEEISFMLLHNFICPLETFIYFVY